jgi:cytochrome c oxidase subunit II
MVVLMDTSRLRLRHARITASRARLLELGRSRPRWAVALVLAAVTTTMASSAMRAQTSSGRVIEVTAERFEFWPPEIAIIEGEPIVIRVRSDDTLHGFRIVGTGTNVLVPKRGKGVVDVKLAGLKAGRYTFECSRLCGAGHNFMRGVLVVRAANGRQS